MKTKLKAFLAFIVFSLIGTSFSLNASCFSEDGQADNRKCDKSDIANKTCSLTDATFDCYVPPAGAY